MSLKVEHDSYIDGFGIFTGRDWSPGPSSWKAPQRSGTQMHIPFTDITLFLCARPSGAVNHRQPIWQEPLAIILSILHSTAHFNRKKNTRCFVSFEDFFSWVCLNSCDTLWPHFSPNSADWLRHGTAHHLIMCAQVPAWSHNRAFAREDAMKKH